jgi:hypothetical protein
MINNIRDIIPAGFSPASRVWIYQSNRAFSELEEKEINEQLDQFTAQWEAHSDPVKGWGKLLFHQFIILMADESQTMVSGCSTDSSVRIIKSMQRQYNVQLFDRLTISFLVKDKVEMLPLQQLQYAFDKGFINENTLFFNNTILTKSELETNWLIPVKDSWLTQKIQTGVVH